MCRLSMEVFTSPSLTLPLGMCIFFSRRLVFKLGIEFPLFVRVWSRIGGRCREVRQY